MLQTVLDFLSHNRVVLASGSARRKEILQLIGLNNIEIIPSTFEEDLNPKEFSSIKDFVEETALQKVLEVDKRLKNDGSKTPIAIIGSDTVVAIDGEIFGKPKDEKAALDTLNRLNGKRNTVYSGVAIKTGNGKIRKFTGVTQVYFGKHSPERIKEYVSSGEPIGKAGSYGIQGLGGTLVEKIDGDHYTVIGLPLYLFSNVIIEEFYDQAVQFKQSL